MKHTFYTLHTIIPDFGDVRKLTGYSPFTMEHAVSDESFQKLKEHAMRGIAAQKIDNTFDNFPVKK